MAIAFRSKTENNGVTGTTLTLTEPAGASLGDLLVAPVVNDSPNGTPTLTRPAGWTLLRAGTSFGTTSGLIKFRYDISYIVRGASPPSYAWVNGASTFAAGHVYCFTGQNATPIDAQATAEVKTISQAGTADPPSVDPVATDSLAFAVLWSWGGAPVGGWTAPTNYTIRSGTVTGAAIAVATRQLVSGAVEDPGLFGGTQGGTEPCVADTFAIAAAGGGAGGPGPLALVAPNQAVMVPSGWW